MAGYDGIPIRITFRSMTAGDTKIGEVPANKVLEVDEIMVKTPSTNASAILFQLFDRLSNVDGIGLTVDKRIVGPVTLEAGDEVRHTPKGGVKIVGDIYVSTDVDGEYYVDIYGRLV